MGIRENYIKQRISDIDTEWLAVNSISGILNYMGGDIKTNKIQWRLSALKYRFELLRLLSYSKPNQNTTNN